MPAAPPLQCPPSACPRPHLLRSRPGPRHCRSGGSWPPQRGRGRGERAPPPGGRGGHKGPGKGRRGTAVLGRAGGRRVNAAEGSGGIWREQLLPPPPLPAAADRLFPAGGSTGGGARPCPSMAFPAALGKSRGRRQRRAALARGGSDLGRRPGGDGPRAAVCGAPAAGAPAGWVPRPALPHRLAAAGCGSPRCRLAARGGLEAVATAVVFMA